MITPPNVVVYATGRFYGILLDNNK